MVKISRTDECQARLRGCLQAIGQFASEGLEFAMEAPQPDGAGRVTEIDVDRARFTATLQEFRLATERVVEVQNAKLHLFYRGRLGCLDRPGSRPWCQLLLNFR